MKYKNILFFGKAGYIDTDDVANNWGQTTKYFFCLKIKAIKQKANIYNLQ